MSEHLQRATLALAAFLVVGGTILALRFARGYRPLTGFAAIGPPALTVQGLRFENVRVIGRHENKPAWRATAQRVDTDRARFRISFHGGVVAELFRDGKVRAVVTAPSAVYEEGARRFVLYGDVRCRVRELVVATTTAEWYVGTRMIRLPQPVRAQLGDNWFEGAALDVDLITRKYTVQRPRAVFPLREDMAASTFKTLKEITQP